jgi:hypothetical protein
MKKSTREVITITLIGLLTILLAWFISKEEKTEQKEEIAEYLTSYVDGSDSSSVLVTPKIKDIEWIDFSLEDRSQLHKRDTIRVYDTIIYFKKEYVVDTIVDTVFYFDKIPPKRHSDVLDSLDGVLSISAVGTEPVYLIDTLPSTQDTFKYNGQYTKDFIGMKYEIAAGGPVYYFHPTIYRLKSARPKNFIVMPVLALTRVEESDAGGIGVIGGYKGYTAGYLTYGNKGRTFLVGLNIKF